MNSSLPDGGDSGPEPVRLRPEQPADEPFMYAVYVSTREEELALTQWDEATRHAFLTMQFTAMRRAYAGAYPAGEFSIILRGGEAVGRLALSRSADEFRVVDVALLPQYRNAGIGTAVLRQVCVEAAQAGKPVRLTVLRTNRAVHWYARLGFVKIEESGIYDLMEWRAPERRENEA